MYWRLGFNKWHEGNLPGHCFHSLIHDAVILIRAFPVHSFHGPKDLGSRCNSRPYSSLAGVLVGEMGGSVFTTSTSSLSRGVRGCTTPNTRNLYYSERGVICILAPLQHNRVVLLLASYYTRVYYVQHHTGSTVRIVRTLYYN